MAYSSDVFNTAKNKLYQKRLNAIDELKKKKEVFYSRFPRAEVIERTLNETSIKAAKSVIHGANSKIELENLKTKNFALQKEIESMLESVNLPSDYLEIKYSCKKCFDEGYIDGRMCVCLREMMKKESYEKLSRMTPLSLSTFENFSLDYYPDVEEKSPRKKMANILKVCKNYAKMFTKNSPGLLMKGATGLGKTHLSLAIANEIIGKGFGVIYSPAQNIVTNLEKEHFKNKNFSETNEQHYINCDLLIIDDLGTEFSTNFSNAAIYNILNSRIMMQKPTIISTNLSIRELEKNYTERMASRIIGNNINLDFFGEDIRQRKFFMKK